MSNLALLGAGPESGTFSPLSLSPFAWYDPSVTSSITSSSGAVSQLNDLSGNAKHMVQATGANQPITGTRTMNSLNVLDFDGVDDRLASAVQTQAQPVTCFVVCQLDVASAVIREALASGTGGSSPTLYQRATGNFAYYAGIEVTLAASDTNAHVISAVFNGASSQGFLDGVQLSSASPSTTGWAAAEITMGNAISGAAAWDGRIGELLIYAGTLSAGNLTSVHSYLRAKWGTP